MENASLLFGACRGKRVAFAWDVHVEMEAATLHRGVFLRGVAATRCLDGNTRLMHRSETDRQPVYDIQRAHEDADTLAYIRDVSKPLGKRSMRKVDS